VTIFAERGARREQREKTTSDFFAKHVGGKDLMQFSRQLAAFVRAGIPILDALSLLEEDTSNPTLKLALSQIGEALRRGEALSTALDEHPKVFPVAYRSMLRSAELTGNLDGVLESLSRYLERDVDAREKVRAAMVYPIVVLVMSLGVVILLTTFVLPKFTVFFASFHEKLPLPTRMLMDFASVTRHFGLEIVAGVLCVGVLAFGWSRSTGGRRVRDRMLLRLPLVGVALRYTLVERFCRILASMTQAGVPLSDAMTVAAEAMNNVHVQSALEVARGEMMEGDGIARPLSRTTLFPAAATQMLRRRGHRRARCAVGVRCHFL
jgi:type IV pilus assembly protein PilC